MCNKTFLEWAKEYFRSKYQKRYHIKQLLKILKLVNILYIRPIIWDEDIIKLKFAYK